MIKCTGNNNGCFMDSCGHDCGCEGIIESILASKIKRGGITRVLEYLRQQKVRK